MDSGTLTYNTKIAGEKEGNLTSRKSFLLENTKVIRSFKELSERVREDFLYYLDLQGFGDASGMLVIPSMRHFFYDAEDLKGVKIVVNLKQLNHIR
ncbi:MAG TPA: hypothetical protein VMV74_11840, partial [Bacteroidales bacterium]|nr:hypothetical protein [Bacteroidales bacterium]